MRIICGSCNATGKIRCHCNGEVEKSLSCESCKGSGIIDDGGNCSVCSGKGIEECQDCKGTGKDREGRICLECRGKGVLHCRSCNGHGQIKNGTTCFECDGQGFNIYQCDCENGFRTCQACNGEGDVKRALDPAEEEEAKKAIEEWKATRGIVPQDEQQIEARQKRNLEEYQARKEQEEEKPTEEKSNKRKRNIMLACILIPIYVALQMFFMPQIKAFFNKPDQSASSSPGNGLSEKGNSSLLKSSVSDKAINAATTLLEKKLTSPSTAKYISRKVVAQEPPFYLVHSVVDSQNSFGAMVRTSALVSVEMIPSSDQFKYNELTSISDESSDPPLDIEIQLMTQLNKWPSTLQEKRTEPTPSKNIGEKYNMATTPNDDSVAKETTNSSEFEKSGKLIDISFVSGGGSSGLGDLTITFNKNGQTKKKVINSIYEPLLTDIDNNGVKEVIISQSFGIGGSNAIRPFWDNIFKFDTTKEELVLVSDKYPDYYSNTYIPGLRDIISSSTSNLQKQENQILLQAATDLVNGKFVPDKDGKKLQQKLDIMKN